VSAGGAYGGGAATAPAATAARGSAGDATVHGGRPPLLILCQCAGTMPNIDFARIGDVFAHRAEVLGDRHWCSREGQARLLELLEASDGRQFVFAGCSKDSASRRFHRLLRRGLEIEVADIREGCSWAHGAVRSPAEIAAVSDKAVGIVDAALTYPAAPADRLARERRRDSVLVIGGGVAGTQAACELAQMGHRVDLVETRPFLGGRAARIGTVFPTNDCGQCLPTTDAQAGVRKCFHRNLAIDDPDLRVWRRASVESVNGGAGDFEVVVRRLPNVVTDACVNCGICETVCPEKASDGVGPAIYTEFYDGRVVRTVDLETCTFCGACADACPVEAVDFTQSPERLTLQAGAVLAAIGCEPAPAELVTHLGYGHEGVVTQTELAELLDDWEAQSAAGRMPANELVMIQCAGSRDRRRLPYCSRLCCMIALKHALRLRTLFPEMKVTICYLELRAAGIGYENWYLDARRAGVEFLRGTPPEVQFDEDGRPVIEVEDMSAGRKRTLRPDLVVLSSGMVPAGDTRRIAEALRIERDEDGFIEILDRKNRATETTREGVFVAGSAAGPKALVECNTEASAVASEIHNFLASAGRRSAPASAVEPALCVGCDICATACPFNAIRLEERPADVPRPVEVKDDGKLAVIDEEACHACGICAASCPEMAIRHNLTDQALFGRLRIITRDVAAPIVGFYCKECAGAAISLSGLRHDSYPSNVRLVELPCLGRVSALHIVEAARLGARGVFLAGCAEGRCQYRTGDESAAEQAGLAAELLEDSGHPFPLELWHLCAVDGGSVGRRIRRFCERALGAGDPGSEDAGDAAGRHTRGLVTVVTGEAACEGGESRACARG
jgi:heterodisulfide reductase subunit A